MAKKRKKNTRNDSVLNSPYTRLATGVILIALSVYLVFIIHKGATIHSSQIANELGFFGAFFYNGIRILVGQCEYFIPLLCVLLGVRLCVPRLNINNRYLFACCSSPRYIARHCN